MVEGLAARADLGIIARRIPGGREISQSPRGAAFEIDVGPAGHAAFAAYAARRVFARRRDTDVVLVQGYGPTAAAVNVAGRAARLPVRMLVCSPVEAYYRTRRLPDSRRPFRRGEYGAIVAAARLNARVGQGYVVLSPHLASVIRTHGTRRPIDIVPVYGVDTAIFRPTDEPRPVLRRRLGLPESETLLFFSSRVAPEKDAATVLKAAGLLAREGMPVRVLNLSGGHRELLDLAQSLGVGDRVIAGDAVVPFEPLADYYRASDVCVQASREEGLGFSPLEALACGVPVVASNAGGLMDTIRDGDTGWTVPVGDPEALARAVRAVVADPAEAAARTARGRALVERVYARDVAFDALLACLRRDGGAR
jgi:glycosyltransferase involved in cell wall biosynthesis